MRMFIVTIEDLRGVERHLTVSEFTIMKGRLQESISDKFPELDNLTAYYLKSILPKR